MLKRLLVVVGLLLSSVAVAEDDNIPDGLTLSTYISSNPADSNINDTYASNDKGDEAKFRFNCIASHFRYDDPILFPGAPGAAHLHMFFGNTLTAANSTYRTLRTTGHGTCSGGPLNRTGYWVPAMVNTATDQIVKPYSIQFYYINIRHILYDDGTGGITSTSCASLGGNGNMTDGRAAACPTEPVGPIVRGLRAISGFKLSSGAVPTTYGALASQAVPGQNWYWQCLHDDVLQGTQKGVFWDANTPANGIQGCGEGGATNPAIHLVLSAPNCWDGTDGSSGDGYSHLAFGGVGADAEPICPSTHPKRIPTLILQIFYPINGGEADYSKWKLSSDYHGGATYRGGATAHFDSFWAWNPTVQRQFHKWVNGQAAVPGAWPYTSNASGVNGVGGEFVIGTINGGLGNDCSDMGISGNCSLKEGDVGEGINIIGTWANNRSSVPINRHRGKGKFRGR
jgi:hypothetical protein